MFLVAKQIHAGAIVYTDLKFKSSPTIHRSLQVLQRIWTFCLIFSSLEQLYTKLFKWELLIGNTDIMDTTQYAALVA